MKRFSYLIISLLIAGNMIVVNSQDESTANQPIVLEALFELPTIPDEITDYTLRYNYYVENFWNPMDFKRNAVGQIQLNHAFSEYVLGLRFCEKKVAMKSVYKLLSNLTKSPTLLYQFTKAAEENLYSDRAEVWIDEIYVKFLEAVIKNKKIKDVRKTRYKTQYESLKNSMDGCDAPKFEFMDRNGTKTMFSPEAIPSILVFGSPDCVDCMMTKIKLNSDDNLIQLAKDNKVRIYFIIPDGGEDNWQQMVAEYPHYWIVGAAENADEVYDIRLSPTIYLINADRKIEMKNLPIENVISAVLNK